jgi:hypothetical protein
MAQRFGGSLSAPYYKKDEPKPVSKPVPAPKVEKPAPPAPAPKPEEKK